MSARTLTARCASRHAAFLLFGTLLLHGLVRAQSAPLAVCLWVMHGLLSSKRGTAETAQVLSTCSRLVVMHSTKVQPDSCPACADLPYALPEACCLR